MQLKRKLILWQWVLCAQYTNWSVGEESHDMSRKMSDDMILSRAKRVLKHLMIGKTKRVEKASKLCTPDHRTSIIKMKEICKEVLYRFTQTIPLLAY